MRGVDPHWEVDPTNEWGPHGGSTSRPLTREVDSPMGRSTHSHRHGGWPPLLFSPFHPSKMVILTIFSLIFSIASFKNSDFNNIFSKNQKVRNLTSIFNGKVKIWGVLERGDVERQWWVRDSNLFELRVIQIYLNWKGYFSNCIHLEI